MTSLAFYNRNYRNPSYQTVRQALQPLTDETERIRLMNMLTDAALDICGYAPQVGAVQRYTAAITQLIRKTFPTRDIYPLVAGIIAHLEHFLPEPKAAHYAAKVTQVASIHLEFQLTMSEIHLQQAQRQAAGLRGSQQVCAYYLLNAAGHLLQTALRHVQGQHAPSYLAESLQRALLGLELACREWGSQDAAPPIVAQLTQLLSTLAQGLK